MTGVTFRIEEGLYVGGVVDDLVGASVAAVFDEIAGLREIGYAGYCSVEFESSPTTRMC